MILRAVIYEVVICGVGEVELEDLNLASNAPTLALKSVLIAVMASISCASCARIAVLSGPNDCSAVFWPLVFPAMI